MKQKNWDVGEIVRQLRSIHRQVNNPGNDGFIASGCKKDLFLIKCIIDDLYEDTPTFVNEDEWHQQRLVEILKK